jgi:hypothetical protein
MMPMNAESAGDIWSALIDAELVLDLSSPYVILGTLTAVDPLHLVFRDADVHDLRDSKTTRELYVLQSRRHGIRCNRGQVFVRRDEIVSFSRLADVME